jgi:hypothetical protein
MMGFSQSEKVKKGIISMTSSDHKIQLCNFSKISARPTILKF